MTPKTEAGAFAGLSLYGLLGYASNYLDSALQLALLIAVLVGAILLAYGRWVDVRNKRLETRIKLLQIEELKQASE